MKRLLFLLAISINMLYCMETKPDQEKQESISNVNSQMRLWQLLGNSGMPDLKFMAALPYVKQNADAIKRANVPDELKEYVLDLKNKFGRTLLNLLLVLGPLSENSRNDVKLLIT